MILLFLFFNLVDAITTLVILDRGGFEANPFWRWVIGISPTVFVLLKVIIALNVGLLFAKKRWAMWIFNVFFGALAIWQTIVVLWL